MKYYGLDIETDDPCLGQKLGASWVYGKGEILVTGIYDAETKEKKALDGNGGASIKKMLKNPGVTLVGANIIYDLGWLCSSFKMKVKEVKCALIDVQQAESCIDEYQKYTLDALAYKYLGERKGAEPLMAWARAHGLQGDFRKHLKLAWYGRKAEGKLTYIEAVPDLVRAYVISDADQPVRIWERQFAELTRLDTLAPALRKFKLIKVSLSMKQRGVRIDMEAKAANYEIVKGHQDRLLSDFTEKYGKTNVGSPKQLAELFDRMNVPYRHKIRIKGYIGRQDFQNPDFADQKKRLKNVFSGVRVRKGQLLVYVNKQYASRTAQDLTDAGYRVTNNPNIDKAALDAVRRDHPVAQAVVDLKQVTSVIDKFLGPKFDRFIVNGRIHADFNISGARQTGRFSSCFSGDTWVTTPVGRKRLRDIQEGDEIITHTGAVARVAALIDRGVKQAYRLTTEAPSSIICTNDHPFMSVKGWEEVGKCKEVLYVGKAGYGHRANFGDSATIPLRGEADGCRSGCEGIGDESNSQEGSERSASVGCLEGRKSTSVLSWEDRRTERNAGQDIGEAPSLERSCVGQQGSPHYKDVRREEAVYSQVGNGRSFGCSCGSSSAVRCASHRRGRGKQRAGQSCAGDKEGSQTLTSGMVTVKRLSPLGKVQVFDLSIDHEDHSFIANGYAVHNCNPNLQQVPSKTVLFRKTDHELNLAKLCRAIIVPDEGMWLGKMDYSGQENVLQAHFAVGTGADAIRAEYNNNPDFDFHTYMGHVTGLTEEYGYDAEGNDLGRKYAKNCGFGLGYGMQIPTMMESFGWEKEFAEKVTDAYNDAAPFVRETMDAVSDVIVKRGFIRTLGGKKLHLRKYNGKVDTKSAYKGYNKLIQGSAADMMEESLVQFYESGYDDVFPLYLTVHDEIDFGVPKTKEALKRLAEVKYVMEHSLKMDVPIYVDPELGIHWGAMKDFERNKEKFMERVS